MGTVSSMKGGGRITGASSKGHELEGGQPREKGDQPHVNRYFDSEAPYWDAVYSANDIQGLIYRRRQAVVLDCVRDAALDPGDRVLEVGCGAGYLTSGLAALGLRADAVDSSPAMVELTAERMRGLGVDPEVDIGVADVHRLPFGSDQYEVVVAVGVIPWLHTPAVAIQEMARVLRPGGRLVLTADNRLRLSAFTDPRAMLALTPLRDLYWMGRRRAGAAVSKRDSPRAVDRLLVEGGLVPRRRETVGFGPITFLGRPVWSAERNVRVGNRLQALADRGMPLLRWTGWHYVVVAEKLPAR